MKDVNMMDARKREIHYRKMMDARETFRIEDSSAKPKADFLPIQKFARAIVKNKNVDYETALRMAKQRAVGEGPAVMKESRKTVG